MGVVSDVVNREAVTIDAPWSSASESGFQFNSVEGRALHEIAHVVADSIWFDRARVLVLRRATRRRGIQGRFCAGKVCGVKGSAFMGLHEGRAVAPRSALDRNRDLWGVR